MTSELTMQSLFQLEGILHGELFEKKSPYAYLGTGLTKWLESLLDSYNVKNEPIIKGTVSPHAYITGRVYVAEGAVVEPTAMIVGPAFIGPETEVRHGAYLRGNVYAGRKCVLGHTTEVKSSIFLDGSKAGHFAYVGDSILGKNVNLGAGTKLANLKLKKDEVNYRDPKTNELRGTGLKKCGALMGDQAQTGCNAVLDPGCILFPNTAVLPCVHFRGTLTRGFGK